MQKLLTLLGLCLVSMAQAQQWQMVDKPLFQEKNNTNGVSFVDIDQDGDLDLFLTNAHTPFGFNTIYRNDGNDNFTKIEAGEVTGLQTVSFGHTWGDFDNDGLPDLFIANAFTKMGSLLYKNLGDFKFRRIESYNVGSNLVLAFDAAWADYDNDGWLDLVTIHPARFVGKPIRSNSLFKNNGDLSFAEIISTPITGPTAPYTNGTWSDYDLDGDMDLFIGSGPANGTVAPDFHFKNQLKETGKATFQRMRKEQFAKDAMDGQTWNWVDYDNDGDLDVFMTNYSGTPNGQGQPNGMVNHFYRNDQDSMTRITEGPLVEELSVSLANMWADFDNDGDLDVIVGNSRSTNKHYRNNGDGSFEYVANSPIESPGSKVTWGMSNGDYDNDGDIDLFISNKVAYANGGANGGDVNYLYRNDLDNGYHWLLIQCEGKDSNRSAIGTIVQVTANINGQAVTQTRVIGTNNTFLGDNDIRAHFGLNTSSEIDLVKISWPSGKVDEYQNIKADQLLVATEGEDLKVPSGK